MNQKSALTEINPKKKREREKDFMKSCMNLI